MKFSYFLPQSDNNGTIESYKCLNEINFSCKERGDLKVGVTVSFLLVEINGKPIAKGVKKAQKQLLIPHQKGVYKIGHIKRPVRKHVLDEEQRLAKIEEEQRSAKTDEDQRSAKTDEYSGIVVDDESGEEFKFIELSLLRNEDILLAEHKVSFNVNLKNDDFDDDFPDMKPSGTVPGFVLNLKRYEGTTISDGLKPYEAGKPDIENTPPLYSEASGFGRHSLGSCAEVAEFFLGGWDNDPSPARAFNVPFLKAVNPNRYPAYPLIIARPMDLTTINKKLHSRDVGYKRSEEFHDDVHLIADNCIAFNGPDHQFSVYAEQLRRYFEKLWDPTPSMMETFNVDEIEKLKWLKPVQVMVKLWRPPIIQSPLSGEEADDEATCESFKEFIINKRQKLLRRLKDLHCHQDLRRKILQSSVERLRRENSDSTEVVTPIVTADSPASVTDSDTSFHAIVPHAAIVTPPSDYIDFVQDLDWSQEDEAGIDKVLGSFVQPGEAQQTSSLLTSDSFQLLEEAVEAIKGYMELDESVEVAKPDKDMETDYAEGEPDEAAEVIETEAVVPGNLFEQVLTGRVSEHNFSSNNQLLISIFLALSHSTSCCYVIRSRQLQSHNYRRHHLPRLHPRRNRPLRHHPR